MKKVQEGRKDRLDGVYQDGQSAYLMDCYRFRDVDKLDDHGVSLRGDKLRPCSLNDRAERKVLPRYL